MYQKGLIIFALSNTRQSLARKSPETFVQKQGNCFVYLVIQQRIFLNMACTSSCISCTCQVFANMAASASKNV